MVATERTIYDDRLKCEITYYRWRCIYCGNRVGWNRLHNDSDKHLRFKRTFTGKNTYELSLRDTETCEPCHKMHQALTQKEW